MSKQKFQRGDLVQIDEDLGYSMSHFTSNTRAVVVGSYDEQYGLGNTKDYTLYIEGEGECSWYHEHQLTLIKSGGYLPFKKHVKEMFKTPKVRPPSKAARSSLSRK